MSGPMTSGFTVGVAAQVFTTQVATLLGVKITKPVGIYAVPRVRDWKSNQYFSHQSSHVFLRKFNYITTVLLVDVFDVFM